MRLQNIAEPVNEWSMLRRSPEFKEGLARGLKGLLRKSEHPDYRKGWLRGYSQYMEKQQRR